MEKLLRTDECIEKHGITKDIRRFQEYYDQVSTTSVAPEENLG